MAVTLLHYSDIENAFDEPDRIGRLAGLLHQRRDETTLVCDTGDTVAPGLLSMETGGDHVFDFFDAVSPDVATFGNHDFDLGLDTLRTVVERAPQQWVVANLRGGDGPFAADHGTQPTTVRSVGGEQIGFVGVIESEILPNHYHADSLTVESPMDATERAVSDLRSEGVDHVVVLSHAGKRDDELAAVDGVDVVLGGHVHDRRADVIDGTPVAHPGARGECVSEIEFTDSGPAVTLHDVEDAPVATDVTERYRDLYTDLGLAETLCHLDTSVDRTKVDRYPETPIGNFVVDAFRRATDTDVAVCHPLMLRDGSPLSGDVTTGELRSLLPFDNDLHVATVSGDTLLALFESLDSAENPVDLDREVYGHISGARLDWRRTADRLELADATVAGEPVDSDANYTITAPGFEFYSDIYPPLTPEHIERTACHQHDALTEYAVDHGIDSDTDGRMTAVEDTASDEFWSLR